MKENPFSILLAGGIPFTKYKKIENKKVRYFGHKTGKKMQKNVQLSVCVRVECMVRK